MKPNPVLRISTGRLMICGCLCTPLAARADIYKADNSDNLNLPGSWDNGTPPTPADIAHWDSFVTAANSTLLGADLSWDGILISNPAGPVTISGPNTLSLGASGIDLSTADQNLTINSAVALTTGQSWNSKSGRRITVSGPVSGAFNLTKAGIGELVLNGSTSNSFDGLVINSLGGTSAATTLFLGKTGGAVAVAAGKTVQFGTGTTGESNLRMLQPEQFGAGVVMTFGNVSGQWGRFDLNGTNQTLAGLNAGALATQGGAVIQNRRVSDSTSQLGPSTLTLNGSGTYLYNGYLRDVDGGTVGNNTLALVKNGTGTQTLAGAQILHTGGTTVNDGKLILGAGGGTGTLRAAVTVNAPGTIDYAGDNSFGYSAGVSVNALTINGATVGGANFGNHFYNNFALNMTGGSLLLGATNNEFQNTTVTVNASPSTATIARTAGNTTALIRVRDTSPMTLDVADGAQPVDLLISAPLTTVNLGSIVTKSGAGTLLLTGAQDNSSTILAATGGTTILDKSGASVRSLAGISNIGTGATVRIAGSNGDQIYALGSGNLGRVNMTGGTLDLAGLNEGWDRLDGTGIVTNSVAATTSTVTLGENNGSSAFAGSINNGAGIVKLVKTGSGTLGLGGNNTLSGTVEVNAGTLALTGSLPASATTVADGAGVAGEGTFSTLTLGATTGTTLLADPATAGSLGVTGALEVKGNTTVSLASGLFTPGVPFKVIGFGSKAGTWSGANFTLANVANFRGTPVFTENANDVSLTLNGANLKWNNAGGNLKWNTNLTANFHDGAANSTFFWGDKVTFDDTPGAAQIIAIDGAQQPASMTVNSQYDYTFDNGTSGSLAGGMSLVKAGSGVLKLATTNTFLGSTTVNGGTLALAAEAGLGATPAVPTAGHLAINGGTLRWDANFGINGNRGIAIGAIGATFNTIGAGNANTVNLASAITGNSPLTLQSHGEILDAGGAVGSTQLTNPANSFTGNVTVTSGLVTINSNFGNPANTILLNGGGLVDQASNTNFTRNIQIGALGGTYRSYSQVTTGTLAGSVSNAPGVASAIFRRIDGGTSVLAGDWSGFAGQFQNKRGNIRISAPNANWANTDYIQDAAGGWVEFRGGGNAIVNSLSSTRDVFINNGTTLNVDSGVISMATNGHYWQTNAGDLGKLTSSSGILTLTNGASSGSLATLDHQVRVRLVDFNGSTPLTFVKSGVNHLGVNQANTHSGGTVVNAGRLWVEHLQALGTGPVTVNNGGQAGLIAAGTYTNNFTIQGPGQAEGAGTLGAIRFGNNTISGNVTVAAAGSRITAHGGFGTLTGALSGSGNLEINSSAANNNGTINLNGNSPAYTGTLTVTQGRLNANGATFGGSLVSPDNTTLGGEATFGGNVTLGSSAGSALVIDASTSAKLTATGATTVNGTINVTVNGYPTNSSPIEVVGFGSKGGAWSAANFSYTAPAGARPGTAFAETANAIVLNLPTTDLVWNNAAATGGWNTNGDANFQDSVPTDQPFFWGDRVTFNDLPGDDQIIAVSGIVEPGSITVNSQHDYTFTGGTIGGGAIVKSGTGSLSFEQANTFTGSITVNGGKLIGAGSRSGTSTAFGLANNTRTMTVNAGSIAEFQVSNLFGNHNATSVPTLVVNGGTVTNSDVLVASLNNALNHVVLNGATLTSTVGSTSTIGGSRPSDTYGAWNINGTVTSTGQSTITTAAPINGQVMLNSAGTDATFAVNDGTLTIATPLMSGEHGYLNGILKTQPGTMVMDAASVYAGPTTINGGRLLANNTIGSGTGSGAVTVNATGTLGGTGAVSGAVTVNSGGVLAPGTSIESLATGALTLAAGSSFAVEYNSSGVPAVDVANVTGNVTLAGSLNLTDLAAVPAALTLGTKLTILTYTGTLSGTFAGLPEGGVIGSGPTNFKVRYADGNAVTLEATNESADPFEGWASSKGLAGADALGDADPDKDGLANLIEFVLGGEPNPANPGSNSRGLLPTITVDTTHLIFTFRRTDASAVLNPFVEYGTGLSAWIAAEAGEDGITIAEDNGFYDNGSTDRVIVRIPRSLDGVHNKMFARLKVTE
ncbi:autotransporter-associated beta strand repeat-containing protein [Luteolibacter arcticus]|uniref:Autotransporter-associated beta strand repeat-containing protein n=1 Tax=Luteolibacter arcticus TaxID=1581411 RepID=A0ABT3GHI1_9BACT|nr:autotransporter-associated beta strand repeat-containing protein [Luteolibacter arcticus]MCW1922918.1 autotransporter-associated beta strand repeat-containing protein [Luteolibacter arcticus]